MATANQQLMSSSRSEAARGLLPREYVIGGGTVLYRFVDTSKRATNLGADGPWWFEFEHFKTIEQFASRNEYSLGYAARLFAAILYEWSEVNAVVRAQTIAPLSCWKGKGKQIVIGKDRCLSKPEIDSRDLNRTRHGLMTEKTPRNISAMTPMQGALEVYQLYIPGLGRPHNQFQNYFKFLGATPIVTG